jgi:serine/threonine protein phosphatase PrpC
MKTCIASATNEGSVSTAPVLSDVAARRGGFPSDKPMEDFVILDDDAGVYVVCDGVTRTASVGTYPNPSPAYLAAKRFGETFRNEIQRLPNRVAVDERMTEAILRANLSLRTLNHELGLGADYLENDLAGTVAVVAIRHGARLYYAYVGDCALYRVCDGVLSLVTPPQTASVAAFRKMYGNSNDVTVTVRRDYRNRVENKSSYGCFTGEAQAMEFVRAGSVPFLATDTVFLASDGLNVAFDRPEVVIGANSAEEVLNWAVAEEVASGVKGDDKAVIRIVLGESPVDASVSRA